MPTTFAAPRAPFLSRPDPAVDNHSHSRFNTDTLFPGVLVMYVCVCNAVTDRVVREAAASGVRCLGELTMRTGCAGGCGACADFAQQLLNEAGQASAVQQPMSMPAAVAA